jgi:hypothetical protein
MVAVFEAGNRYVVVVVAPEAQNGGVRQNASLSFALCVKILSLSLQSGE